MSRYEEGQMRDGRSRDRGRDRSRERERLAQYGAGTRSRSRERERSYERSARGSRGHGRDGGTYGGQVLYRGEGSASGQRLYSHATHQRRRHYKQYRSRTDFGRRAFRSRSRDRVRSPARQRSGSRPRGYGQGAGYRRLRPQGYDGFYDESVTPSYGGGGYEYANGHAYESQRGERGYGRESESRGDWRRRDESRRESPRRSGGRGGAAEYSDSGDRSESGGSRDDTIGHYKGDKGDIIYDRYRVEEEMGVGTFGRVIECHDGKHNCHVAVKVVRAVKKYTESAKIEAEILEQIVEKNGKGTDLIVQMYKHFTFQGHYCMVFEKLGVSLYDFLKSHGYQPYPLDYVREFGRQLLEALDFLQKTMKLIHTDLKPENILLCSNETVKDSSGRIIPKVPKVKVIDFGGATWESDDHKSTIVNTRQYRGPEVILELGWSYPSDIWSAGCIIAELYTGELLFPTHNNTEHLALMERSLGPFPYEMVKGSRIADQWFDKRTGRMLYDRKLDQESLDHVKKQPTLEGLFDRDAESGIIEVVSGMLRIDPSRRYSAERALSKSFFRRRSSKDRGGSSSSSGRRR